MTKTILMALVAALAGCADDDDRSYLKGETTCGDTWNYEDGAGNSYTFADNSCDAACVPRAEAAGDSCETNLIGTNPADPSGVSPIVCQSTFTIDGERGCCTAISGTSDVTIKDNVPNEPVRTRRVFFLTCK